MVAQRSAPDWRRSRFLLGARVRFGAVLERETGIPEERVQSYLVSLSGGHLRPADAERGTVRAQRFTGW